MISIIIPTLNEESVIEGTLSFLKTNLTIPHEVIISDGKSTDATAGLARKYADKVLVYSGTTRQTIAMGRNDGAAAASGEFLAFMDADCRMLDPNAFIARALSHFEHNKETVALTVSVRVLPEYETLADKIVFGGLNRYLHFMNNVLKQGIAAGEFQLIRRSAFDEVGGYNPALVASEDVDMFFRLSKVGKIVFDHKLFIYHTGRRGHAVGWPKLISIWMINTVSMMFRGKAHSKEWTVIR